MNSNYSLQLTAIATYKGQELEFTFDPYNDCTDLDGLQEFAAGEVENSCEWDFDDEDFEAGEVSVRIKDYDEIPQKWANEDDLWEFAEAFAECEQDIYIVEAAFESDIHPSDIDEAYQGSYKDDEDFAYEMAESLGAIDKNASWPQNCIDWEYAAKELMYDYCSHNGHYFRNL
jgi:antirestriction protein